MNLPGIGEWTANYVAMRVLGDPDHPVSRGKLCGNRRESSLNTWDPQQLTERYARDALRVDSLMSVVGGAGE